MRRVKYVGWEAGWQDIQDHGINPLLEMLGQEWNVGLQYHGGDAPVDEESKDREGVEESKDSIDVDEVTLSEVGSGPGPRSRPRVCKLCTTLVPEGAFVCGMCGNSMVIQLNSGRLKKAFPRIYGICHQMCSQREPYNWQERLYAKHEEVHCAYLDNVLSLLQKHEGPLLLERMLLAQSTHTLMTKWLRKFFMFLDRYLVKDRGLPTLLDVGRRTFQERVFAAAEDDVLRAIIGVINAERDGGPVADRLTVRSVVSMFEDAPIRASSTHTDAFSFEEMVPGRGLKDEEAGRWREKLRLRGRAAHGAGADNGSVRLAGFPGDIANGGAPRSSGVYYSEAVSVASSFATSFRVTYGKWKQAVLSDNLGFTFVLRGSGYKPDDAQHGAEHITDRQGGWGMGCDELQHCLAIKFGLRDGSLHVLCTDKSHKNLVRRLRAYGPSKLFGAQPPARHSLLPAPWPSLFETSSQGGVVDVSIRYANRSLNVSVGGVKLLKLDVDLTARLNFDSGKGKGYVGVLANAGKHGGSLSISEWIFEGGRPLASSAAYDRVEKPLLEASREYFRAHSRVLLENASQKGMLWYAKEVDNIIDADQMRMATMFCKATVERCRSIAEVELVKEHLPELLSMEDQGCEALLSTQNYDGVRCIISLASRPNVGGVQAVASMVEKHVAKVGRSIIASQTVDIKDVSLVSDLCQLHARFSDIVDSEFKAEQKVFRAAIDRAFASLFHDHEDPTGRSSLVERIALAFDSVLRGKGDIGNGDEIITHIVRLVGYLQDKDVFMILYRKSLCSRLVDAARRNLKKEAEALSKLQQAFGPLFVYKAREEKSDALKKDFAVYLRNGGYVSAAVKKRFLADPTTAKSDPKEELFLPGAGGGRDRVRGMFPYRPLKMRPAKKKEPPRWVCAWCNTRNEARSDECSRCSHARKPNNVAGLVATFKMSREWACPKCTLLNVGHDKCTLCECEAPPITDEELGTELAAAMKLTKAKDEAAAIKLQAQFRRLLAASRLETRREQVLQKKGSLMIGIEAFHVQIASLTDWPSSQQVDVKLPPVMQQACRHFSDFHMKLFSGRRKLTWLHQYGYCELEATFNSGTIDLSVTTLQAIVLLMINPGNGSAGVLSFSSVQAALGLSGTQCKMLLHSLACVKGRNILAKTSPGKVSKTDNFAINVAYELPKRFKGKCLNLRKTVHADAPISMSKTVIKNERDAEVEYHLIRILKAREEKTLDRQQLVEESMQHEWRFPVSKANIEAAISNLTKSGYLKASDGGLVSIARVSSSS